VTAGLKRHYGQNDLHFITFSCYQRQPFLDTPAARNLFLQELSTARTELQFKLVGYVVMPEHVHLLISEPAQRTPSFAMQIIKQRTSRKLHKMDPELSPPQNSPSTATPFWERRFYDFNVFSLEKRSEKLHYIHANPVSRGLVKHIKDWPWCSWSQYASNKLGLIPVDIGG
jgi:putative transposase